MIERLGAIQAKPGDLTPLRIDEALVRKMLVAFLQDEAAKAGFRKAIVNVSGGIDSAAVAFLAAEAYRPENVTALLLPYRSSDPASVTDARDVARVLGVHVEEHDITPQVDAYFAPEGGVAKVDRVRAGNKMARERMSILYDRSLVLGAIPLGTSNKTELLLGYGTIYGDMASAINPVGDLYKSQLWQLADHIGVPTAIVQKAPPADLWSGQSDEAELGFQYRVVDRLLYYLVDRRYTIAEAEREGFTRAFIEEILGRVRDNQYKRRLPVIAKLSSRTIDRDFRYPRDWG